MEGNREKSALWILARGDKDAYLMNNFNEPRFLTHDVCVCVCVCEREISNNLWCSTAGFFPNKNSYTLAPSSPLWSGSLEVP